MDVLIQLIPFVATILVGVMFVTASWLAWDDDDE